MNEINRLEAMMETDGDEKTARLAAFEATVSARLGELARGNGDMQGNLSQVNGAIGQLMAAVKKC